MRVGLCQVNPTVGDLEGNFAKIVNAAQRAADEGAQLAVFCELALLGYPPRDLLERSAFVADALSCRDRLAAALPPSLAVLVGVLDRAREGSPHQLHNAVALIRGGRVERLFHKRLLPTYDVFDEARYFEPGVEAAVFDLGGLSVGVTICEDAWNDVDSPLRQHYQDNPVEDCMAAGAELLVNMAASPFTLAKREGRSVMLAEVARKNACPLIFVNQVGGNDDLIFDGCSALMGDSGETWARAPAFESAVLVCELASGQEQHELPAEDAEAALQALVFGTRDYAAKCGFERAVLGLSGGIDSALTACIAAQALGAANVLGVAMPTRYSSEGSRRDARELADALGIEYRTIEIDEIFQGYLDVLSPHLESLGSAPESDVTYENIQARIRGNTLMAISNRLGHLLLTTGNKSEIAVGYCTLYGDMAGGLAVISDLPKTFVYEVARTVNRLARKDLIPRSTLDKPPSAELRPDQTDQDSLPDYDVLDAVLERLVEEGQSTRTVIEAGFDAEVVERVAALVRNNEYKRRQMPPGLIVTSKAFGPGRRYPIAQRYRG